MALFEHESQFTHLLNPIRDLTKNWNVDIAFYLEEYLNELEHISISFDGGKTTMNFVQAALLIQGSACVYGKKVDFLYNLVLQLLDLLKTNKKEKQTNEHRNKDGNRDAGDQLDEFVPLDITASDNIDLKDENEVPVKTIPRSYFHRLKSDKNEKGDFPIYNIKDELVGNKNDFGIHFNRIHKTGTTLQSLAMYTAVCIGRNGQFINKDVPLCAAPLDVNHNIGSGEVEPQSSANNADGLDDAVDDVMPNDDVDSLPGDNDDRPHDDAASPDTTATRKEKAAELTKTYELRKRKDIVSAAEKALLDWKPLNPQDAMPSKLKMALKGPGANMIRERKIRSSKKKLKTEILVEKLKGVAEFCNDAFYSHAHKLPKEIHKLPSYSFLDQAFYEEMKRRKLELQKWKSERVVGESDGSVSDYGDNGGDPGDEWEGDDINHEPIRMRDFDNRSTNDGDTPDDQFDALIDSAHNATNYEELVTRFKGGVFEPYERITGIAKKVKDWEDSLVGLLEDEETHTSFDIQSYCTKIIENFTKASQKETINFSKVVKGATSSEVARYFLATLQLANNNNIDISNDENGLNTDAVHLTLLSRRQHFEQIDEFQT